ncbi:TonB-dependent receptor domain-containing protein [Ferrimonas gelatinilytica]|uniref:TonB-dependent receptor n=1 Tax=Ferrimonas gelatinilytica TaxID=1255257 RepID=A0ABP9S2T6_9GAMM
MNRVFPSAALLAVLPMALCAPLQAAESGRSSAKNAEAESSPIERMVVTGDRFAQAPESVLAPITVIDRADLDRLQAKSLAEVLRTLPSVSINQYGGRGQNATVSVRGATSAQTLVLIDGMRIASGAIGPVNINAFPLAQIERIEFIRGARASLYGSEAMSGVINIITRDGAEGTALTLGAGSFERIEASARHQQSLAGGTLKAVLAYEDEAGYNVHPVPGVNDGDRHGFTGKSALLSYANPVAERVALYGALRWFENVSQYDNSSLGNPAWGMPDRRERKENWIESLDLQLEARYQGEHWQSQLQAQVSDSQSYDYLDNGGRQTAPDRAHLRQHNLAWLNRYRVSDSVSLSGGADWRRESLRGDSRYLDWFTGTPLPFDEGSLNRDNTGLFALGRWEQDGHSAEASVRSDDNAQFGRHNTWQLGGRWAASGQVSLVAMVGTAFRAPSFYDLYYPGFSNPDLRPESSDNWELALEASWIGADWRLGGFRQKAEDLIQFDLASNRPENLGHAVIDGVEMEVTFVTGPVEHQLSYSWRDSEDRDSGKQLVSSARHNGKWALNANWQRINVSANLVYRGSRYGDAANSVELDPYFLVSAAASYHLDEAWVFRLRVENLFDETYLTIADTFSGGDYPGQGRSLSGQVSYRF